MFKNRLQEVCQERKLPLPKYTTIRDGPDHNPRFKASVDVGDFSFDCPDFCKSSKEAQGEAARVAFEHFDAQSLPPTLGSSIANIIVSSNPPEKDEARTLFFTPNTTETDRNSLLEMEFSCKSQLQRLGLVRQGSFHNTSFKGTVTVDGQTFQSLESYNSLKEAENVAAKCALLNLSKEANQDTPLFFKSMLQELVQKQCLSSPVYETVMNGPPHLPAFVSTVEVEGEKFVGVCATTKKQAEQNAAKVAFQKFKECGWSRRSQCPIFQVQEQFKPVSLVIGPKVTAESQQLGVSSIPISCNGESTKSRNEIAFEIAQVDADNATNAKPLNSDGVASYLLPSSSIKSNIELSAATVDLESGSCVVACVESSTRVPLGISEFEYSQQRGSISTNLLPSKHGILSTTSTFKDPMDRYAAGAGHSLKCNRIAIYPRNSGVVPPPGATVMPCSDEKWLAFSFGSSKE